jgi:hypothetical protein
MIATYLTPADQMQGCLLAPVVDRAKRDRIGLNGIAGDGGTPAKKMSPPSIPLA